jgi:hypothetical protein
MGSVDAASCKTVESRCLQKSFALLLLGRVSGIRHEFYDMMCEDTFRHSWNVLPVAASAGSDGTGGIEGKQWRKG